MTEDKLKYNWVNGEEAFKELYKFLMCVDEEIIPQLSHRVDIFDYAHKLLAYADNIFVYVDGDTAAGCSVYCNQSAAYISSFAVKKKYKRRQIGSIMMKLVKEHVKNQKCKVIHLEADSTNEAALKFYMSCGFRKYACKDNWVRMEYRMQDIRLNGGEDENRY